MGITATRDTATVSVTAGRPASPPWLTENVLGVRIMEPGCTKLEIKPHLGNLSWAKGTFPTPFGIVHISHKKKKDGSIESKIKAPAGVTVIS